MPPDRCALEPVGPLRRDQDDELERVVQPEAAELPSRNLRLEEVAGLDRPREPPVRTAFARQIGPQAGTGRAPSS